MPALAGVLAALAVLAAAGARVAVSPEHVSVVRRQLSFDELHTVTINNTIEYILEFIPTTDEGQWPSRVWLSASGGNTASPVLITARQTTGAQTWQLPYEVNNQLLFEMQRTLCQPNGAGADDTGDCADETQPGVRGQLSLHVGSACAARVELRVQVSAARDWRLPYQQPIELRATQAAAGLRHFQFGVGEPDHVRLVIASEDDVCATVAVYNYSCPIPETAAEMGITGLRMTVQRSGGVQLSRSQYPRGFVVVAVVQATDKACTGDDAEPHTDWLWEAALGSDTHRDNHLLPRLKNLTVTVDAALSRGQYALATSVAALVFLAFYAAFGGVLLARRWPAFKKLVAPRAILQRQNEAPADGTTEGGAVSSPANRRRHDSTATFDSSDNSDSEEEPEPAAQPPAAAVTPVAAVIAAEPPTAHVNGAFDENARTDGSAVQARSAGEAEGGGAARAGDAGVRPFGLPAQLVVAALARRRDRTLRVRSDRYLHTLATVAVFYALPVLQFVAAFQLILNVSGSLDLCYYNFLCAHPAGALSDFNHVYSNLGYLLLGALFMLQVRRRRRYRRARPKLQGYGIPAHYGMLSALGAGMMMVALLSASYHVCPNQLNFQFDTAFMYVLAVLSMVKIYQARHPDINARAHATFGVLAVVIALVVWGVLGGGALFWGVFTVLHIFTFLLLSLRIYYVGQFRLDKQGLAEATRGLRELRAERPLYSARLVMLLIANGVNWLFALYGLFTMRADFAGHMLQVLLGNTLLYMVFYLAMKLLHGERLRWYAWCWLAGAAAAWVPSLYFFVYGSSDWSATPAVSRHSNHECKLLHFYDSHDLWHMLSAVALYFSFNAMLTWDDGLSAIKRTDIAVF